MCEYLSKQKDVCLVQQTNEEVAKLVYTAFLALNFLTLVSKDTFYLPDIRKIPSHGRFTSCFQEGNKRVPE